MSDKPVAPTGAEAVQKALEELSKTFSGHSDKLAADAANQRQSVLTDQAEQLAFIQAYTRLVGHAVN